MLPLPITSYMYFLPYVVVVSIHPLHRQTMIEQYSLIILFSHLLYIYNRILFIVPREQTKIEKKKRKYKAKKLGYKN